MSMKTVHEVSVLSGVSVRTLHHYDAIGLLKPSCVTDAGYRLYDGEALQRLQSILLFRELQFPLKEIGAIIDRPDFDKTAAVSQQLELLLLQRKRLDELISLARKLKKNGADIMDFKAFDTTELDRYREEAKKRWGDTDAYKEYESKNITVDEQKSSADGLMDIFVRFGKIRELSPESKEAAELVAYLRSYITENYYTCTVQILAGLGQMYRAGGEMTDNIDRAGGKGTAEFSAKAIEAYCKTAD